MLNRENTGLIVVDIQGKLAGLVYESDTVIANCATLIQGAKALDLPIVLLEQNPERLGSTISELSCHLESISPIPKFTFNACECPEFLEAIKFHHIENWIICGIEAHICVYQTARSLVEQGYNVELVSDCVSSRTHANLQVGINRSLASGAAITSLEMCLYELVKDCRTPEFKKILGLVR